MTVLLKGERWFHVLSGTNTDTVMTAFDLPAESVLRNIRCKMDIIGVQIALEREKAVMYALAAYLVQLDDPDEVISYESLWDQRVQKSTDVDLIDWNTGSTDTTPFWEPGEAIFEEVFESGDLPQRLWMRKKRLTFADPGSAGLRFQPSESPFEPQWMPADIATFNLNKPIRVSKPSVVMVGMSNPALDDTTTTRPMLTEFEWGQIQYIVPTLERAFITLSALTESGAESPYEEAPALLRKHLAPDVFEETAAAFLTEAFNVFGDLQFEHTVPGTMEFASVDLTP